MKTRLSNVLFLFLVLCAGLAQAANYKPYVQASADPSEVKDKLTAQGFEIVGEYSPLKDTTVIVVTSEALKKAAAQSEFGGYGAIQRVAITSSVVSYTNPTYWAYAYRMKSGLADVAADLKTALGSQKEFGSEDGMSEEDLREYHYAWLMPYFDDQIELATHASYDKAVSTVEAGLKAGKGGTQFVYRVDIPGKDETVFGMGLTKGDGADQTVLATIDKGPMKHTAYLPYEILVSGKKVYMLPGKFRIALSFPDLSMGQFMKIFNAPDAIEAAAKAAAE